MKIRLSRFSDDGMYRYQLIRVWDDTLKFAMCIGLNPSKAGQIGKNGEEKDDPTITRLIGTLKALGFGGLYMVNLYGYISSKPEDLFSVSNSQGDNDEWIANAAMSTQEIIFCWGAFQKIEYRVKKMIALFPDAKCFGKNADGSPWHPRAMSYIKDFTYDKATLTKFRS